MAERYRRQTIIDLDSCSFPDHYATTPAEDHVWANRMVWIYAHVLNFCFGPESERSLDKWEDQNRNLNQWQSLLPSSFTPLYSANPSPQPGNPFPTVWFLSDWHGTLISPSLRTVVPKMLLTLSIVLGMQTFHMAKVLLNLYAPGQSQDGIDGLRQKRVREVQLYI